MTAADDLATSADRSELLRLLVGGWVGGGIAAAAELGIADALYAGHRDAAAVATAVGIDADATSRLLRLLHALNLVYRDTADHYTLTPVGELLRPDHPQSMFRLARLYQERYFTDAWGELVNGLRTGAQPFTLAHGETVFDYLAARPAERARYSAGIAVGSSFVTSLPDHLDFGGHHVLDVGGGDGTLLDAILTATPDATGSLVERPEAAGAATTRLQPHITAGRATVVAGDFFAGLPAGADTIVLCRILHNWDDERARAIVRNCRAALRPGGRLLIVERVVSATAPTPVTTAFDLHMFVMTSGRERTDTEYRALLSDSGFDLAAIHHLPLEMGAVEGHVR